VFGIVDARHAPRGSTPTNDPKSNLLSMTHLWRGLAARLKFPALIAAVAACVAVAAPVSSAHATTPNANDRYAAKVFARDYWRARGYETTCYGVRVRLRPMSERRVYDALGYVRRGRCTIWLNSLVDWSTNPKPGLRRGDWHGYRSWWKTCRVMIHEFGHLPGIDRPHTSHGVMAWADDLNTNNRWWPYMPACRYDGDDKDGDGWPDY
jgi:hypothetical protein